MQPSRPNRNAHPISTAFSFQSWSEVSHAKADGTRPSAIVHDVNAVDHDRRASTVLVPWRSLITRPDRAARYLPVATGSSGSIATLNGHLSPRAASAVEMGLRNRYPKTDSQRNALTVASFTYDE